MAFDAIETVKRGASRRLIGKAVHRNTSASTEGLLERLFTLAFSGLVYPQIWEDPAVDMAAMEIEPNHHIVAIASGGCNVLSYLTAHPARITAVDLNRAHVALTCLKLAGAERLPGWQEFYRFFGDADEAENLRAYRRHLRPYLDSTTRRYWEGRTLSGRCRLTLFKRNLYRNGLLGRFIGVGHVVSRAYGKNIKLFLQSRSIEEQRAFFTREIAPLFEKRLVRWLTDRRVSLYGLGIPPAQYEALAGGGRMADVLRQRLERLACDFPLRENYFAWQAFGRGYAPGGAGPVPPYLAERNFAVIRAAASKVSVRHISLTDALADMKPASVDRFVLLDAQDWMTDAQLNALWREITRTAAPGARVIFRTAGTETILPGRVADDIMALWRYEPVQSRQYAARDRSSIYGGFHLYVLEDAP